MSISNTKLLRVLYQRTLWALSGIMKTPRFLKHPATLDAIPRYRIVIYMRV